MRRIQPEQSLAARFPEVAATWHPTTNGVNTPENTSARSSYKAHWQCAEGHQWVEAVSTRTSLPGWKRGDVTACRICVGHHVETTFACGHTVIVDAKYSRPERNCPPCRRAEWDRIKQQRSQKQAAAQAAYTARKNEAEQLLASLAVPPELPEPLVFEWRRATLNAVQRAIVSEREFGKTGATGTARARAQSQLSELVPTEQQLRSALDDRQPVRILDRAYWPLGWLHILGHSAPAGAGDPVEVRALAETLQAVHQRLVEPGVQRGEFTTTDATAILTHTIENWAAQQEPTWRHRCWCSYRELTLPLAPAGAIRFGRLDVVIMRPNSPDLAIEIDSADNPASAEKLDFARDAGAVPIWVRWNTGPVRERRGVHLIDLRSSGTASPLHRAEQDT